MKSQADPTGILPRLAHWEIPAILTVAGTGFAAHGEPRGLVTGIHSASFILALLAMISARWWHNHISCPTCYETIPLDARGAACGDKQLPLRIWHFIADHLHLISTGCVAGVIIGWWVWWVSPALWIALAVYAWSQKWHDLLKPWCPYCHRGGGWEELPSPPDPIVVSTRDRHTPREAS